jgi:tetratricopeptide (TPR) repeat protein
MLAEILARLKEKQVSAGESGIDAVFDLNWETLDTPAQKLACLLSMFALAPIPWSLVESATSAGKLEIDLAANRAILIEKYLLQQLDVNTCQVHERVQELLRAELEKLVDTDEHKRGFCQAMVAVAQDIPQTPTQQQIAQITPAIPHLAEAATLYTDWLSDDDLIWPFVGLGRFYLGQGAYKQALPWWEQCVSISKERLGDEHPDVAISLNNLAELYRAQGRYAEAKPLYQQALEMTKRLLGDEHPNVATNLNNLAELYRAQGRYAETESLYRQALEMRKRLLGDEHPDVASSLNNLALLYRAQGRYAEAESLYRQALEIAEQRLGVSHPNTVTIRENLHSLLQT